MTTPKKAPTKFKAWDRKLKKMRKVLSAFPEEGYAILKDQPENKVSLADIDLLHYAGITSENRKGIYEGDIVSFSKLDDIQIGLVVLTATSDWIIHIPKSGKDIPLPWNQKGIHVLGNKFENEFYLTDEYARLIHVARIQEILSSHQICEDKYCRHDLQKAIESLSELSKDDLINIIKSMGERLRDYKKSYFEECSRNRHR